MPMVKPLVKSAQFIKVFVALTFIRHTRTLKNDTLPVNKYSSIGTLYLVSLSSSVRLCMLNVPINDSINNINAYQSQIIIIIWKQHWSLLRFER